MSKGGFPGMGGMGGGNMQQLMRQAQKMQTDMQHAQEALQTKEYTATTGGGMVTAVVSGSKELKTLTISKDCVDPDDVEMLQDLVLSAVNEALRNASEDAESTLGKLTGGINLGF
ncbi:MAG: YbaB/EbfC family nucleoid-associated protein [Clostridia bacterium]